MGFNINIVLLNICRTILKKFVNWGVTSITIMRKSCSCSYLSLRLETQLSLSSSLFFIGSYVFEPFGVETLGPWGPSAHLVFRDISKRLVDASRDLAGLFCRRKN